MNDVMRWEKYQCETGFCTLGLGKKKKTPEGLLEQNQTVFLLCVYLEVWGE